MIMLRIRRVLFRVTWHNTRSLYPALRCRDPLCAAHYWSSWRPRRFRMQTVAILRSLFHGFWSEHQRQSRKAMKACNRRINIPSIAQLLGFGRFLLVFLSSLTLDFPWLAKRMECWCCSCVLFCYVLWLHAWCFLHYAAYGFFAALQ